MSASRIEALDVARKSKAIDQGKKLVIKNSDELDILEADTEKENYLSNYRKNIVLFATCGKKRSNLQQEMSSIIFVEANNSMITSTMA